MTRLLFLTEASPQEAGIIRAMETGNTSPSLSSSPSPLPLLDPQLSLSLYLLLGLSPSLLISVISHVHLFAQIIRCRGLRVRA